MTIARGPGASFDSAPDAPKIFSGRVPAGGLSDEDQVPVELRADRLTRQIDTFVRAGYMLETRTATQAIVVRSRTARTGPLGVASTMLRSVGIGRSQHRVVITVDRAGAVRFV